jgi:hypothetical protein
MTKQWTSGDLAKLDNAALMQLLSNAHSAAKREKTKLAEHAVALIPQIEAEQARRALRSPLPLKRKRRTPRSEDGRIERHYADAIVDLVASLNTRFDLSPETAISLSSGLKKFTPRSALGTNGDALVGGAKLTGKFLVHRYTAYRIRNETVLLVVILEKNAPLTELKFIIQASAWLLTDPQPLSSIRPVADVERSLSKQETGQLFYEFTEAAQFYENVLAQIAPTRTETI